MMIRLRLRLLLFSQVSVMCDLGWLWYGSPGNQCEGWDYILMKIMTLKRAMGLGPQVMGVLTSGHSDWHCQDSKCGVINISWHELLKLG
jgi:hypothetical protein